MKKILVPCDGSPSSLAAVRHAGQLAALIPGLQVELLNVQDVMHIDGHLGRTTAELEACQSPEAERALQGARAILDDAGVAYTTRCRVGAPGSAIALHVHEGYCDAVVMGSRGMSAIASVLIGSVASRVLHLVHVPVTLVK